MEAVQNNAGFIQRNNLMRVGNISTGAYKPEGTRFFGRLLLDLSSCESGLPPHTKVNITLEKASSEFCLMRKEGDTEKYQVKFLDVNLYVPVAQLSQPTFNEISTLFATKSIALHYRRVEITTISLPRHKQEYFSDALFNDDVPCRVIVCFIEQAKKQGDYSNPYNFKVNIAPFSQRSLNQILLTLITHVVILYSNCD